MNAGGEDANQVGNSVPGGKRGFTRRGEHQMYSMNSEVPINTTDLLGGEGKLFAVKYSSRRSFLTLRRQNNQSLIPFRFGLTFNILIESKVMVPTGIKGRMPPAASDHHSTVGSVLKQTSGQNANKR
jgi:hypothetical protein